MPYNLVGRTINYAGNNAMVCDNKKHTFTIAELLACPAKLSRHSGMQRRSSMEFTIIELLVVIGIIGILATMLLPALSRARDKAKEASCFNNLKQIGIATHNYAADYKDFFPLDIAPNNESSNMIWKNPGIYHHFGKLAQDSQYINGKSFFCPLSKSSLMGDVTWGFQNFGVAGKQCNTPYKMRGTNMYAGAPTTARETRRKAQIADQYDSTITDGMNHNMATQVLFTDGSVVMIKLPKTWTISKIDLDPAIVTNKNSWSQLDSGNTISIP